MTTTPWTETVGLIANWFRILIWTLRRCWHWHRIRGIAVTWWWAQWSIWHWQNCVLGADGEWVLCAHIQPRVVQFYCIALHQNPACCNTRQRNATRFSTGHRSMPEVGSTWTLFHTRYRASFGLTLSLLMRGFPHQFDTNFESNLHTLDLHVLHFSWLMTCPISLELNFMVIHYIHECIWWWLLLLLSKVV